MKIIYLYYLLSLFLFSTSAWGQEGEKDESDGISQKQKTIVQEILNISRKESQSEEIRVLDFNSYKSHLYWRKVFELGESVSPEQSKILENTRSRNTFQAVTLNSYYCKRNEEGLDEIVGAYKQDFYTMPGRNGAYYRRLKSEHATPKEKPIWEMLLLSPQVEKIGVKRCMEALNKCADLSTLELMRHADLRFVMGGPKTVTIHQDIRSVVVHVASVLAKWVRLIEKVDPGGETGAKELIYIIEYVDENFPQLNGLERFKESSFYDPGLKGVREHILEDVFMKKDQEGNWIWKKSLNVLLKKNPSEKSRKLLEEALGKQ